MPDLLNTSLTGMLAFQRALDMTGHNIANANTPGYSRQVAEFGSRVGSGSGSGYIGGGTQITTIKRVYDEMLGEQLRAATSSHARFATLNDLATRIDSLLADPQTGLSSSMQSFFNAVQDVSNDPSSIPARQAVLGEADGIIQRLQTLDGRFAELDNEVNQRIITSVTDINRLADAVAELNDQVVLATGRTGQPPNDLLDQRDLLIRQIGEQVSVATTMQDDGSMNVYMGSGQVLVTGIRVNHLATQPSEFDPTRQEIVYQGSAGNTPLDSSLAGGVLGGLLEYRSQLLEPSRQALGETAVALVENFNQQHGAGMDLRGNLGTDFFDIGAPTVLTSGFNGGTGTANVAFADVSGLTGADYILEFDGANYALQRTDSGQTVAMTGSGSAADPFVADGISIVVGGAPAAGDRLMIRPSRDIAASVDRRIDDPQAIAMASPVRVALAETNLGDAAIGGVTIADPADPNLLATAVIQFLDPNTYSINGAGAFAYNSGDTITINGANIVIEGAPETGDSFMLEPNYGGTGDNGNGLLLASVQTEGILAGGTVSINDNYGQLIANVGSTTRQVQANLGAQTVLLANTEESYLAKSGVNLDEEAANLLRYQQAYQAVAQVVSVANTLFDSLLAATRR